MRFIGLTMAKGTSSRLPRKNLLPFAGRPLVEWTFIAMRASRYLTDHYIVTESKEIAELAYEHDFRVIWQTAESAGGAGHYGAPVCEELFFKATKGRYQDGDVFVSGLPTSPCRKPQDIDVAIGKYMQAVAANPGKTIGVGTMVRRKDLQLMEERDGTLATALFENQGKYLMTNGSIGVRSYGYAREQAEAVPGLLEAFHSGTHYAGFARDPDIVVASEDEVWQQWDIDTMRDFQMCEQLFMTNGLGDAAYRLYRGRCSCSQSR